MIAERTPPGDESQGVLGDGALHAGKGNMALVRRAVRNRWPVGSKLKRAVVRQMAKIATSGEVSERDRIAASKVLVAADALNARREQAEAPQPPGGGVTVNVGVAVQNVTADLLNDPDYIAYQRRRARDADARAVRQNGEPREVADGGDARTDRRGLNGHGHGANGTGPHR